MKSLMKIAYGVVLSTTMGVAMEMRNPDNQARYTPFFTAVDVVNYLRAPNDPDFTRPATLKTDPNGGALIEQYEKKWPGSDDYKKFTHLVDIANLPITFPLLKQYIEEVKIYGHPLYANATESREWHYVLQQDEREKRKNTTRMMNTLLNQLLVDAKLDKVP